MKLVSNIELKSLFLAKKEIEKLEKNKTELAYTVKYLVGFLNNIHNISESWSNAFRSEVNLLELIIDSINDNSIRKWDGDYHQDQSKSLYRMKIMIDSLIQDISDSNNYEKIKEIINNEANWVICPECFESWQEFSTDPFVLCNSCGAVLKNMPNSTVR